MKIKMRVYLFGCSIFRSCGRDFFPGLLGGFLTAVMHLVSVASKPARQPGDRHHMLSIAIVRWKKEQCNPN